MPVKKAITELQYQASEILSEKNKHSSCRDKLVSKVLEIQVGGLESNPKHPHTKKQVWVACGGNASTGETTGRSPCQPR